MQVRVETLADLKRIKFNPFDTVFCVETEKEYFLNLSGGSLTPDDDDIVQAIHGANARYVAMVAKVIGGTPGSPAILDESGKIPLANMPSSVFTYKGGWNAATNTPTLADGVGTSGDTYRVTNAGSVDFGAGAISFAVGDKAVYNGTVWEKWDVTDDVATLKTYITAQATPTRVTGAAPDALGEYRSYLRNGSARTYTETNGSPTTAPGSTNGYVLYAPADYTAADASGQPSRYEIYIGLNKEPVFEFYSSTGRTGKINIEPFQRYGGVDVNGGVGVAYDPTTGVAQVYLPMYQGAIIYTHLDENGLGSSADIYFDIKC